MWYMTPCTVHRCIDSNVSEEPAASVFGVVHSLISRKTDFFLNNVVGRYFVARASNPNGYR